MRIWEGASQPSKREEPRHSGAEKSPIQRLDALLETDCAYFLLLLPYWFELAPGAIRLGMDKQALSALAKSIFDTLHQVRGILEAASKGEIKPAEGQSLFEKLSEERKRIWQIRAEALGLLRALGEDTELSSGQRSCWDELSGSSEDICEIAEDVLIEMQIPPSAEKTEKQAPKDESPIHSAAREIESIFEAAPNELKAEATAIFDAKDWWLQSEGVGRINSLIRAELEKLCLESHHHPALFRLQVQASYAVQTLADLARIAMGREEERSQEKGTPTGEKLAQRKKSEALTREIFAENCSGMLGGVLLAYHAGTHSIPDTPEGLSFRRAVAFCCQALIEIAGQVPSGPEEFFAS